MPRSTQNAISALILFVFLTVDCVYSQDQHWIQLGPHTGIAKSLAVDPTTPQIAYVGFYDYGLFKSSNGGTDWIQLGTLGTLNRASALAIDPTSPETIYVGGFASVNKSTNGGIDWIKSSFSNTDIVALAINPVAPQTIYAGTSGSGLFKSTDGGNNWSNILRTYASEVVNSIAIDPKSPEIIYAGTDGSVFKSTNGGTDWFEIDEGLPRTYFNSVVIDPDTPQTVYL